MLLDIKPRSRDAVVALLVTFLGPKASGLVACIVDYLTK